jgi:signal peptidase
MNLFGKWISGMITNVLLLVLILMLIFTISSKINGGRPNLFGYEILTVLSGSMEPKIQTGSLIAVKPVADLNSLHVGDVITYQSPDNPDMLITHRIVEVREANGEISFITKGDNNDSPDIAPVPSTHVVAKYQNISIPYLGYILSFSKTKPGIILMMIIPGVILVVSQLINIWRIFSSMEEKKEEKEEIQDTATQQPIL